MIARTTQGTKGNFLKYDRRIIIVTDGRGEMDTTDLDDIASKIKDPAAPIDIVLLGVDFDDSDTGFKEEEKERLKVFMISMVYSNTDVNRLRMRLS